MGKNQKQLSGKGATKKQKQIKHANILEGLKDIGGTTVKSIKHDLLAETSKDFFRELLGTKPTKKLSGEITPGGTLEINEVFSGRHEESIKLKKQLALERRLREEEKARIEKKSNELKIQLQVLMEEITVLAQSTQGLAEETQIAAMQAPVEPGIYHIIFFEKLLEFIKSFRKKINEARVWLAASNKRAQKKNFWGRYKKHGGKFLLAADHYVSRSAG